jgi:hypothetical protein
MCANIDIFWIELDRKPLEIVELLENEIKIDPFAGYSGYPGLGKSFLDKLDAKERFGVIKLKTSELSDKPEFANFKERLSYIDTICVNRIVALNKFFAETLGF